MPWEYLKTTSNAEAYAKAIELGWYETPQKVQIRQIEEDNKPVFLVEPFEWNCTCKGIIKRPFDP